MNTQDSGIGNAQQPFSQDAYVILKLEAALLEITELSEGSPSSYRDFGDIAREALKLMEEARGGKPTPNLVPASQSVLEILRLQNPERVRQDAEQPGHPNRQVVLDDGPNAGLVVATCEYESDAELIVEIWNWARTLTPEKPLYGHKSGKRSDTHWVAFLKANDLDQRTGRADLRQH